MCVLMGYVDLVMMNFIVGIYGRDLCEIYVKIWFLINLSIIRK